jgi:pimeloyl-ACP methyl ester carboxylesterase
MEKVVSRDGTSIAYHSSGSGAPLVLVHGTSGTFQRWAPVLPLLERHFTVYAMDRRGRGESGDSADPYSAQREFEDVAAVVDAIGTKVHLFGHSYGAVCALEASLLTERIDRLILYEPPIPPPGPRGEEDGVLKKLQDLLTAGERAALLTTFMRKMVRMSSRDIRLSKSMAAWPARVAAAHTIPREILALREYSFEPLRFRAGSAPTLLLLGGESPDHFRQAVLLLESALPNSKTVVLAGQQHVAMETAPELLAEAVSAFLLSP